jgi:hypothetical protein
MGYITPKRVKMLIKFQIETQKELGNLILGLIKVKR